MQKMLQIDFWKYHLIILQETEIAIIPYLTIKVDIKTPLKALIGGFLQYKIFLIYNEEDDVNFFVYIDELFNSEQVLNKRFERLNKC